MNRWGLHWKKKRALVKNALLWHRHKGTKNVIEEMISILFSKPCRVTEWFEYDGEPYFFRVYVEDIQLKMGDFEYILRAVWELKNVRSWLEKIIITKKIDQEIFTGGIIFPKYIYEIPHYKKDIIPDINAFFGTALVERKKWNIYHEHTSDSGTKSDLFFGLILKVRKKYSIG